VRRVGDEESGGRGEEDEVIKSVRQYNKLKIYNR